MTTTNKDSLPYARNTQTQEKQSTGTGMKNYAEPGSTIRFSRLTRQEGMQILDRYKGGTTTPYHLICEALIATGDMT